MKYTKATNGNGQIKSFEVYEGESIEEKMRRVTETGEPIEDSAPIIFQERKEGCKPEYDIRTDKFEIMQNTMTRAADNIREKRKKRATDTATAANREVNVPAGNANNQ